MIKEDHRRGRDHTINEGGDCTVPRQSWLHLLKKWKTSENPWGFTDELWDVGLPIRNGRRWYGLTAGFCSSEFVKRQGQRAYQNKKPAVLILWEWPPRPFVGAWLWVRSDFS